MASPAYSNGPQRAGDTIKLEYGRPEIFCPMYITGKSVESRFPGGRVMFSDLGGRKLFIDDEDAGDLERGMRELRIAPGADFVRVTKIRHPRGGGHSIRIERVDEEPEPDPPSSPRGYNPTRTCEVNEQHASIALLEKSVELAKARGPAAFSAGRETERAAPAPARAAAGPAAPAAPVRPESSKGTMTGIVAGALMASIDAYLIAADYAASKGIKVNLEIDFNAEDIRQSATAMCIQYWRDGGTR